MYFAAKKTRKRAERYSALAGKEKAFSTFRLICLKRRGAGIACWDMKKTVLLLLAFVAVNLGAVVVAQEDISKLDKNFAVEKLGNIDVAYRDALSEPFVLEGFPWHEKGRKLFRLPHSTKPDDISGGVYSLASHTAGGVVRFRTDSPYIVLRASLLNTKPCMGHMPSTGSSGFDLFFDTNRYIKTVNPSHYMLEVPTPLVMPLAKNLPRKMRDCTLYLPLYNGVNSLEIGLAPDAKIEAPTPHKIKKPILFYGSSITQGACATRTSNAYAAMLCRALDAPMINLGFSGNAKGEIKMAELIASLDLAAFVYDYDYNAPTAEHLKKTHEQFFKIVRKARPDLPIIIFGKISGHTSERDGIVRATYENAVKNGDKKVWLVEGKKLFEGADYSYLTVDNCHPNDLGFFLMFKNSLPTLKEALGTD